MSADKKNQILNAAIECFTTYGFEKTSMNDIGKLVGLNKASLYYHFKDKRELFNTMVQAGREKHRNTVQAIITSKKDIMTRVVDFLCGEIGFIEQLAVNFFIPVQGGNEFKNESFPVFTEIINEDIRILTTMITEERNKGNFLVMKPAELAGIILHTSRGLLEIDCPLDKPLSERAAAYKRVRSDIKKIIPLLLKGAGG